MAFVYCSCGKELDTPTPEQDLSEEGPMCPNCGREYIVGKLVEEYVLELIQEVEELKRHIKKHKRYIKKIQENPKEQGHYE